MTTVSTLVNLFGVSKHTIRAWSKEFSPFLSSQATPPSGERRRFTEDDLKVFALIAHLREQNARYEDIHAALSKGERMELVPQNMDLVVAGQSKKSAGNGTQSPMVGFAPVELIESFAQRLTVQFQDQINELRDQIHRLERQSSYFRDKFEESQTELKGERNKWVEAVARISRMEAELESAAKNEELLKEERSARINAQNRLAAAQAKAEKLEALMATNEEQKGRPGLFNRR